MELHPIENDDGNIAEEVLQAVEENQQDEPEVDPEALVGQPSPAMVYDRIVQFEETLKEAWDEFKEKISSDVYRIERDIGKVEYALENLQRAYAGKDNYSVGTTVVVLDMRKFGTVQKVTNMFVDVMIDEDKKVVRKRKKLVKKINCTW